MSLPPEDRNVNADAANPPFVAPGQEPDAPPDPGASQASARTEPAHDAVPDAEPPSEWDALRAELAARPFEPQRWYRLVQVAETAGETEKIRAAYDGLLSAYPNTHAAQIRYLDHFLAQGDNGTAEELFKKFLRTSPSVELWKHYLSYVRRMNTGPQTREVIKKSYDFALNHVGQDKDSGSIWEEYIQFLKDGTPATTWEEQQKMDQLRKVYHKAVQIPLTNVERLWTELEAFENGLNRIVAKKHMTDLMPSYMQARQVLRDLQREHAQLYPSPPENPVIPGLFLPAPPAFTSADRALVGAWKKYLKWEEGNPLELDEKDRATLHTRIQGIYRKAVVRMRFFGEIWYMAYVWTKGIGKEEEAEKLLKAGIEANPDSFVLHFAYAESLELQKKLPEVHALYTTFVEVLERDLDAVEARESPNNTVANVSLASLHANTTAANGTLNGSSAGPAYGDASQQSSQDSQVSTASRPSKSKELAEKRTQYALVWITYMRFARRAESLQSARDVFKKARTARWTSWEVYEAAALIEYHCTKRADIATRIFETGMKGFSEEVEFVQRYLGFLISINDEQNARGLFELAIAGPKKFAPDVARPLWERWTRYVYQYSDLAAAQEMEKRMAEAYPNDPPIKRFAQRHTYLTTDAIASRDLGFGVSRQNSNSTNVSPNASSASLTRGDTSASLSGGGGGAGAQERKRPPSPDRRRDDGPYKRPRPPSPPGRERERGRDGIPRRRYGSPGGGWERDAPPSAPPPARRERERDEPEPPRPVTLPPVLSWFIGTLPPKAAFDGPVFRTDDLMQLFRNAVIPSSGAPRNESPAPGPRGGGRPPPDYGPYQGPGGGGRGGRRW